MNKSREKEVSKSNSEIMDVKPNLLGSSKSFLVRLSSQAGYSQNKKGSKDNKGDNKQNILNKVNERKAELNPDNYRRRNNEEKSEDKTKNNGRRNNSNNVSQTIYSSKSYSNIRDNKRENNREVRNNKVEIENKNKNVNNRRGNEQKVDNQNKTTYKNTIPISNYNNNQIRNQNLLRYYLNILKF